MTYATQADLNLFLQISITNDPDPAVDLLLEDATGLISSYLDRRLELATYTDETYERTAGAVLRLKERPIVSVTSVTEGGTALVEGTDFLVYKSAGYLRRIFGGPSVGRAWLSEYQAIVVTYDAGYDFTPPLTEVEPLVARDTCVRMVSRAFQAAAAYAKLPDAAQAIKSISLEGSDSITYRDEILSVANTAVQLTSDDMMALSRLKKRRVVSA